MNCPTCGCFMAAGEDQTPYGSDFYWWCSWCQTAMADPPKSSAAPPEEGDTAGSPGVLGGNGPGANLPRSAAEGMR